MSQNPKIYLLLLFLVACSFVSIGQERDSLKSSQKVLDRLELEITLSLLESQDFNAIPGGGLQVAVFAPFDNGRLRLGLGIGYSRQTFRYSLPYGRRRIGRTYPYSSQLDAYMLNVDLTLGTDFLPDSPMDLLLEAGIRINKLFQGNYHFDYSFLQHPSDHLFSLQQSIHPAAVTAISFSFPISNKSSMRFSYGLSYSFLPFKLKTNSESNQLFYESNRFGGGFDGVIVAISEDAFTYFYHYELLELPSHLGGQHSFSISYRYTFGLGKKTNEKERNSHLHH